MIYAKLKSQILKKIDMNKKRKLESELKELIKKRPNVLKFDPVQNGSIKVKQIQLSF